jgi:hypothetical protein
MTAVIGTPVSAGQTGDAGTGHEPNEPTTLGGSTSSVNHDLEWRLP